MKGLTILHKWLVMKIEQYKLEIYNESTYSWSSGYKRALIDIKEFVEIELEENK